jgi:hypothetical protein
VNSVDGVKSTGVIPGRSAAEGERIQRFHLGWRVQAQSWLRLSQGQEALADGDAAEH